MKHVCFIFGVFIMAGPAGFEPTMRESKSLALPLGYGPTFVRAKIGAADGNRTHQCRDHNPMR